MGILSSILDRIRGAAKSSSRESSTASYQPSASSGPAQQQQYSPPRQQQGTQMGSAPRPMPSEPVDVEAVLTGMAQKNPQKLNWRESIVDLMKLLDLDSDLASRKELAKELGYSGDVNDSATMNIWLHKQVMQKLAADGGRVPPELLN